MGCLFCYHRGQSKREKSLRSYAQFTEGFYTLDLNEGKLLTLAPGMKHDVEAREDCAFLLTIAWCAMK